MAAYEVLLLNTAIPQIQAAQSGDTYLVPRDIAFSTVANLANGTNLLPSLTFSSDTNTGIYREGADALGFTAGGGTNQMVLTSTGLGIGTNNPAYKLDVNGNVNIGSTSSADTALFVKSSTVTGLVGAQSNYSAWSSGGLTTAMNIGTTTNNGISFGTNNIGRLNLDSSGNLGLGVTPSAWLAGGGSNQWQAIEIPSGALQSQGTIVVGVMQNAFASSIGAFTYKTTAPASWSYQYNGEHYWANAASGTANTTFTFTERARISSDGTFRVKGAGTAGSTDAFQVAGAAPADAARITSGGDLLVGQTSGGARLNVTAAASQNGVNIVLPSGNYLGATIHSTATSGDNQFIAFGTEASFTTRGSISYNRAGGLTAYNTTSDYRAKDIISPVANSGAIIDALKVYEGKMKGATQSRPMLVAHEAQEHAPYAVSGVKDEVNEDGTPKYQQMDVSSLVPLLLAEIQSLRARVAQLEQGA